MADRRVTVVRYVQDHKGLQEYLMHSPELRRIIDQRAELTLKVAKALAPKGTRPKRRGQRRLAESMRTQVRPFTDSRKRLRYGVAIRTTVPYGAVTELGRHQFAPYRGAEWMANVARYLNTPAPRRRRI